MGLALAPEVYERKPLRDQDAVCALGQTEASQERLLQYRPAILPWRCLLQLAREAEQ